MRHLVDSLSATDRETLHAFLLQWNNEDRARFLRVVSTERSAK